MELTNKQTLALNLLTDNVTKWLGYGGAAGGGKTILGCYWQSVCSTVLPESRWFIGRDSLTETRESVLYTFRKLSKILNLNNWRYNDNHIYFDSGSTIDFLDLSFQPNKDPLYERFGSLEYTGGWIEEAGQVHPQAFEILKTRVNRWNNTDYGMLGKILVTFNPRKNWVDTMFYRPYKNGTLDKCTKFIKAVSGDNPYLDEAYIENLNNIKDKSTRERLLNGNFDYDDDPTSLISYEDIMNIWTNIHVIMNHQDKCITCDVARFGSDRARIMVWYGMMVYEVYSFDISKTTEIQNCINSLRVKHSIPASRCIADEDGVGGGVVDNCGIIGFTNNGKPFNKAYNSLKDECGYMLAECIKQISFTADISEADKEMVEQELAQLKTYDADKDSKLRLLPKAKIKQNIGHSPDWLDNFIMRMYFKISNPLVKQQIYNQALKYV